MPTGKRHGEWVGARPRDVARQPAPDIKHSPLTASIDAPARLVTIPPGTGFRAGYGVLRSRAQLARSSPSSTSHSGGAEVVADTVVTDPTVDVTGGSSR